MNRPKFTIVSIEQLKTIVLNLFKDYEEIQLAYLYGSYAKGLQTEYSDIDIGIILDLDFEEPPLYFAELSSIIEKNFNYKINIDLKILNNSTPRFLFKVIKDGIMFYAKNQTFMHEFELKVLYDYQEIKPMLDTYDKMTIMEVLDSGN